MFRTSFHPAVSGRLRQLLALLIMMLLLAFMPSTASAQQPSLAPASTVNLANIPCDLMPDPATQLVCNQLNGDGPIPNPVEVVADTTVAMANTAGEAIFSKLAEQMERSVSALLKKEFSLIDNTAVPNVLQTWFIDLYGWAFGIAAALAFAVMLQRTSKAARDGDPVEFISGPAAFVVMLAAGQIIPALVALSVAFFDGPMTDVTVAGLQNDMDAFVKSIDDAVLASGQWQNAFVVPALVAFFGVIGGVIMMIELLFREYALYVFTAFHIIALGMWVGGRWAYKVFWRATMSLIGLIMFKWIAAVLLLIGVRMIGTQGQGADAIFIGAGLLLLLPALTWKAYKAFANHDPEPGKQVQRAIIFVKLAKR